MTKKLKPEIIKRLKDIKEHPERMISHDEMMKKLGFYSQHFVFQLEGNITPPVSSF